MDRFITKVDCAKDKVMLAQKMVIIVTGIAVFRPYASIHNPTKNAPIAIPTGNLIFIIPSHRGFV